VSKSGMIENLTHLYRLESPAIPNPLGLRFRAASKAGLDTTRRVF
jgi:hypothetical protein